MRDFNPLWTIPEDENIGKGLPILIIKEKVLIICSQNSARSQMPEGFLQKYGNRYIKVFCAGFEPAPIRPMAIKVMQEFDFVVTVCDKAGEACPWFPGAKQTLHQGFPDPSTFIGTDEEIMERVRQVRDQIKDWIVETFPC